MYAILVSFGWTLLSFVLRTVVIKFVVFAALLAITVEFMPVLFSLLPDSSSIVGTFDALPDGVWFFLYFFNLDFGVAALIAAYLTRFIIRRIPVIG